jgi:hypothetical protein
VLKQLFLLFLVAATSLLAYLVGRRVLAWPARGLAGAVARALELIGMSVLCLIVNLAVGLLVILALRALGVLFITVYLLDDASLVALSVLQGLVLGIWRTSGRST